MESLPERKPNRLKNYDYSTNGIYFITICTKERQKILWTENHCTRINDRDDVGANSVRPLVDVPLNIYGRMIEDAIHSINSNYPNVYVENYVIMPNHIHLLLFINAFDGGRTLFAPTISRVIKQFKGVITKRIGKSIFQRSFHDHIICGQEDYETVYNYIDSNPFKWEEDCFTLNNCVATHKTYTLSNR